MIPQVQQQIQPQVLRPAGPESGRSFLQGQAGLTFAQVLEEQQSKGQALRFSGHALDRLRERKINLTPGQLDRLDQAVTKASQKGAKSSFILLDKLALIVSIKNKTVITAIDEAHLKENVFTNIDSAIIS